MYIRNNIIFHKNLDTLNCIFLSIQSPSPLTVYYTIIYKKYT